MGPGCRKTVYYKTFHLRVLVEVVDCPIVSLVFRPAASARVFKLHPVCLYHEGGFHERTSFAVIMKLMVATDHALHCTVHCTMQKPCTRSGEIYVETEHADRFCRFVGENRIILNKRARLFLNSMHLHTSRVSRIERGRGSIDISSQFI